MAGLLHSESRRLYSWWWDSHISPKSSKWLQENLTDMDAKVKAMIKLIEEDADSFARRAEMYYKKRPELMKLVEEFYRAYRALAERYDNVTVELRFAHRRMAEAFPNQVPFLPDDSPSGSISSDAEPQTPVLHPIRKIFDSDDQHSDTAWLSSSTVDPESSSKIRRGLKQLNEMFGSGEKGLDSLIVPIENSCITNQKLSAAEEAGEAELELQALKKVLAEMQAEKEAVLAQYQQSMEKLTDMEKTLGVAQENARGFDDQRSRAEIEISKLNEALANSEAERDSGLLQYNQTLSKISELETNISLSEENAKGLGERAIEAETQLQHLRQEIMRLEAEKEAGLHQYDKCLCRISSLEGKILIAEENARVLSKKNDQLEAEIERLKQAVDELNEEKEAVSHQYKLCLDIIARLESEVSQAHENVKQLNGEISRGATLLKNAEETNATLKKSNHSLVLEVDDLMDKIGKKDQEILDKQNELEKLQICMQDEHSRLLHVEASLNAWQEVHCQSQERQESLALELKNGLEMLKDFEISKHSLEEKIFQANEENRCLNELNLSSADSIKHLQAEIAGLREMKEKLQEEVSRQVDQSNSLQQEIFNLKEEINDLNSRYQALLEQLETVGFTPESDWSSLGKLLDESSMLKEMCKKQQDEKDGLLKKLGNMETLLEKNAYLENSLLNANGEIERSKEKLHALQESCQFFQGEKSSLVSEKAILLSQLQVVTESMRKLLEKNSVLDNSLAIANVEIAGLRDKSKSLEEICQMIRNEKSNLHMERSTLISQLESVQERLKRLENRFTELEEKYCGLEKEKNSTLHQVEELRISFGAEKKQHEIFTMSTEAQLATLENQITLLQNQGGFKKKEFEEELEKAVKAQVELFILQKFVKDLEEKNSSLSAERQKLLEASKFSDKLISQLNMENLEQQVETEFLLDEIERLRSSIYQVFKALQIDSEIEYKCKIDHEDRFLVLIQKHFESIKNDLSRNMEEKQQLLVENLVLVSWMGQLELESIEFASAKRTADHCLQMVKEQLAVVQCEKQELQEMNKKLKLEISERVQLEDLFRADKESLEVKIDKLEEAYILSQDQNLKTLEEMKSLSKECSELKKNVCMLEDENDAVLHEAIVSGNLSLLFQSLGDERAAKLEVVVEHLDHLNKANSNLEKEVFLLMEKLETIGREHVSLKDSMEKNDRELHEFKSLNDRLNAQILVQTECLMKKEAQCSEAEQMLEASEKKNRQLHIINEALDEECRDLKLKSEQKICSLTRENEILSEDIKNLSDMNGRMVSNLDELAEEIEKYRIREDNLCSELLQKGHDFEIWEAEAATFYFDLQVSTVHEVLYANKIQELAGVCATLEEESASKDVHIELMEEKIKVLESHVDVLKSQLSAYIPAVDLLTEDIASLEHNAFLWTKHHVNSCHDSKVVQSPDDCEEYYCKELVEPGSGMMPDRISELQEFRCRLKAVERAVAKDAERLAKHDSLEIKLEAAMKEIEQLKFKRASIQVKRNPQDQNESRDQLKVNLKLKIPNSSPSVAQEIQMKDIQLDQVSDSSVGGISKIGYNGTDDEMLEMWEAAEKNYKLEPRIHSRSLDKSGGHIQDSRQNREGFSLPLQVKKELGVDKLSRSPSESDRERNKRKIVEKLTSDAQKLMSIQDLVQELRKKMMATKCKKSKVVEFETVREQLQEIDESLIQLMDINCQLVRKTEGSPSSSGRRDPIELEEARGSQRKRIVEQVRRESEKIARLQLEVKKIQYILLKQEEEKKTSRQYRFSKSKTSIVLSNFIHSGSRNSRRRKKGCLSGCMRKPSTPENEVVTDSFRAG